MEYSGAGGETDSWKNQKQKISWHSLFKMSRMLVSKCDLQIFCYSRKTIFLAAIWLQIKSFELKAWFSRVYPFILCLLVVIVNF